MAAALVRRRVRAAASGAEVADIDAWWAEQGSRIEGLVARGYGVGVTLAARYLRQHAAIEGRTVEPEQSEVDVEQVATSLHVAGPVAFKVHMRATGSEVASLRTMQQTLAGSAERFTLMGGRDTVMRTFTGSDVIVGYRRITSARPCAFCAMLASRGAVYSKRSVDFQAHDNCSCTAEPLYEREPEPASVQRLRSQWDEYTEGRSGTDALAAFSRGLAGARSA